MDPGEDPGDKPHDPSQRRLEEARRKGDIPLSSDLTGFFVFAALLLAAGAAGPAALSASTARFAAFLADAAGPVPARLAVARLGAEASLLLLGAPVLGALAGLGMQRGFVFSGQKLAPKMSRLSPIENARKKYGRSGLFEFAKSVVKMLAYAGALFLLIRRDLPQIAALPGLEPRLIVAAIFGLALRFLAVVVGVAAVIAAVDFGWQVAQHRRRNRMSRKDVTDEAKEQEGDPHQKAVRRQRGIEIASRRMLADVPGADVVIVNPTHYAVALKWERGSGRAPFCVAKGTDLVAARIRGIAAEHGVPIRSDPPTARSLFAGVDIGQEIDPAFYRPVAAAIRFADRLRQHGRRS